MNITQVLHAFDYEIDETVITPFCKKYERQLSFYPTAHDEIVVIFNTLTSEVRLITACTSSEDHHVCYEGVPEVAKSYFIDAGDPFVKFMSENEMLDKLHDLTGKPRDENVDFEISEETLASLDNLAAKLNISRTEAIVKALIEQIEQDSETV